MTAPLQKLFDLARRAGDGSVCTPVEADKLHDEWKRVCAAVGPDRINTHGEDGYTVAHVLARRSDVLKLFEAGREAGMDFNAECATGVHTLPIHSAAVRDREGDQAATAIVNWLLDVAGADGNAAMTPGWTPLHLACCFSDADRVDALIKAGANLEVVLAPGNRNLTPLLVAAARSSAEIVKLLLLAGADASKTSQSGTGTQRAYQLALNNQRIPSGSDVLERLKVQRCRPPDRPDVTRRRHLCAS